MGERTTPTELRGLRLARGLTQEALAARVGVSRQAYAAIESGSARPSVDVALRIGHALDASVEALFSKEKHSIEIGNDYEAVKEILLSKI